jgi:hypothetical protein
MICYVSFVCLTVLGILLVICGLGNCPALLLLGSDGTTGAKSTPHITAYSTLYATIGDLPAYSRFQACVSYGGSLDS